MLAAFRNKKQHLLNKLGFEKDQNGILKRYLCESDAWTPHLKKTKEAILNQTASKSKNKAAILGSGWLLDVPLPELVSLFSEIWLFDIHHPSLIKKQVSKYKNVKLVETDISGLVLPIFSLINHNRLHHKSLEELSPSFSFDLSEFDFIVSCNLLNQLDIIILDYITKHFQFSAVEETRLRNLIQQTHLNLLPSNKSCLITDTEEIWINKKDEMIGQKQLIFADLPENKSYDQWIWLFDNQFSYHHHCKTWLKVKAYQI